MLNRKHGGALAALPKPELAAWQRDRMARVTAEVKRGDYELMAFTISVPLPSDWEVLENKPDGARIIARSTKFGVTAICSCARERDGRVWLHLSASHPDRVPNHEEMCAVKSAFVGDDAYAYAVYPPADQYVNDHGHCLHLWCCLDADKTQVAMDVREARRGAITPDFRRGGSL